MRHSTRALLGFALILVAACAGPLRLDVPSTSSTSPSPGVASAASSMRFHFLDHLSFGARIEHLSLLLDGLPAYESDAGSVWNDAHVTVRPGPHTLAVVLRASEPCGLLDEPRTTVAVEATASLRAAEGPASVAIDLYGTEATSDPLRSLGVRFVGDAVARGAGLDDPPPAGCDHDDALCAIDALAERARSRRDASGAACYEAKRSEIRSLKDVIDDSYSTVKREGTTTGAAESAQLRARYAEERIRAITFAVDACGVHRDVSPNAGVVARKVERLCPGQDVTAGLDRY